MSFRPNSLKFFRASILLLMLLMNNEAMAGDIKGKVQLSETNNCSEVLIYLEHVNGSFHPSQKPAQMDQKKFMFIPDVLPVLAGTTVNFMNSDSVLHNVFTPTECAGNFNLGTWPRGEFRSHTFNDTGCVVTILCDVHPNMQAWIIVLQNPYFVKANSSGDYEIKNIPKGTYNLKVWCPFYKTKSVRVVIKDSGTLQENFSLRK
ncbi:MAG: hypothetical protein WCA84_18345 [Ignavibacteriaceae bacterium]